MYELLVKTRFAAAHQLREYDGLCANLHGHTWAVEVSVAGRELDQNGMLMDFKKLKEEVQKVIENIDHRNLNDLPDFGPGGEAGNPTAENVAGYIFKQVKLLLASRPVSLKVTGVRVWESPDAAATYREEE
ncbi:MAG: 6-carboxytetrahydropterin synthase QueD [Peptococcaceae bacterium]|nr:MAG: 6-carboxytetrahydropterin synthase QueD [Peptococcaceae bacterium]